MLQQKQIRTLRRGRISSRREVIRQLRLRQNLEKQIFRRLNSLFRKFFNTQAYLFGEFVSYNDNVGVQKILEEMNPVMLMHYRKVFRVTWESNNEVSDRGTKDEEVLVMGRSIDFERVVNEYFNTRTLILTGIAQRLATRISNIIEQGRADNLTLPQIAANISNAGIGLSRNRAALIARTETHNAASFANHRYYQTARDNLGITMVKRWVATSDDRTRSTHASANGQTVHMDNKFIVGGAEMDYAGDPAGGAANTVNCRCVIVYADENDIIE